MKLPFLKNVASVELKNEPGQAANDTTKVCDIFRFGMLVEVARTGFGS